MMLIIVLSFLVTGAISYVHYKKENEQYHRERLRRKEKTVLEAISYHLHDQPVRGQKTDSIVRLFSDKICELADINRMDINIFSLDGELLISSSPTLHEENLLPRRIPNALLQQMSNEQNRVLVQQQTDSVTFLSTYSKITNSKKEPIAVINLPYFDVNDYHREDLATFLWSLGQIYLILFLTAVLLAYLLSNYITHSLKEVGEKIKNTRLSENNPRIEWPYQDEIGTLMEEYNRMLEMLEKSAQKLAQQERQAAWSQMARQVAHEIKNPLTPMRLNVQHLQRQLRTDEPEKLRQFAESMIEQIDILSNIASTFSSFAALPEMQFSCINPREAALKVARMYAGRNIAVKGAEHLRIKADKEQLTRALNNIINNALQAIPEGKAEKIVITVEQQNEEVHLHISDNGVGIAPEQIEKIFEPRFTTKSGGMGLGLAMVKSMITSFGGRVSCHSTLGEGTVITLVLPLVEGEEARS